MKCPVETFGCKLYYKTDSKNNKLLSQAFTCFDKNKTNLISAADIIEMPKEKQINIAIESYQGAVSVYSTGYGFGGHESANGVVQVDELNDLKESAKRNRQKVLTVMGSNDDE